MPCRNQLAQHLHGHTWTCLVENVQRGGPVPDDVSYGVIWAVQFDNTATPTTPKCTRVDQSSSIANAGLESVLIAAQAVKAGTEVWTSLQVSTLICEPMRLCVRAQVRVLHTL